MLKRKLLNIYSFRFFLLILLFVFSLSASVSYPQQNDSTKSFVTIVPGPEYKAGWFHEIFFGEHWRELWTTPIKLSP